MCFIVDRYAFTFKAKSDSFINVFEIFQSKITKYIVQVILCLRNKLPFCLCFQTIHGSNWAQRKKKYEIGKSFRSNIKMNRYISLTIMPSLERPFTKNTKKLKMVPLLSSVILHTWRSSIYYRCYEKIEWTILSW